METHTSWSQFKHIRKCVTESSKTTIHIESFVDGYLGFFKSLVLEYPHVCVFEGPKEKAHIYLAGAIIKFDTISSKFLTQKTHALSKNRLCRFPGKKFIENQNENTRRLQYNPIEMSDMRTLNYTFFQRCSHVLELTRNSDVVESMYSLSYIPETVYDKSHLLSLDDTSFTESIVDLLKWFKTNSAYSGYGLVKQENEKKKILSIWQM